MRKIRRALISVADKRGVVELSQALSQWDCEILSTGGTLQAIHKAHVDAHDIAGLTHHGEAFGGRVKTLSFETAAALLFDRECDQHEAEKLGVPAIDLVVCNFYPFSQSDPKIEMIDIGGPTMVRAAAKNYRYVAVVTHPDDYAAVISELHQNQGSLSFETRHQLMRQAFNCTADYEATVAAGMDGGISLRMTYDRTQPLRYGENSHQKAFLMRERGAQHSLCDMEVLGGKALSYNNLLDVQSAIDTVRDLDRCGCAVIKHNIPCGLAEAATAMEALQLAWAGDPVSAFGSVIAFNIPIDEEISQFLSDRFVEVVIAPAFTEEAQQQLRQRKGLRLIVYDPNRERPQQEMRFLKGALLIQEHDATLFTGLKCATKQGTGELEEGLLAFGLKAVRHVRSNAIVVVRPAGRGALQVLGVGSGQPNRLTAVRLALDKCRENLAREFENKGERERELARCVLVSEAFFPFRDSVDACEGVRTIVQPGGSIRDHEVVAACDEKGIAMVMTGIRHFKH